MQFTATKKFTKKKGQIKNMCRHWYCHLIRINNELPKTSISLNYAFLIKTFEFTNCVLFIKKQGVTIFFNQLSFFVRIYFLN